MRNIVIFNRVSTQQQDCKSQREDLLLFSKSNSWNVVNVFDEVKSGYSKNEDRIVMNEMIDYCIENDIKTILIHELSRLGRSVPVVVNVLDRLTQLGISVFIKSLNMETLSNGERNPFTSLLTNKLISVSSVEKDITQNRLRRGYES